jgi:hypothetical protein
MRRRSFAAFLAIAACAIAHNGCGGGGGERCKIGGQSKIECSGGESRQPMCCELEFKLDATNVKGDVKTPWGGAGLQTETKAVREISDALQAYSVKANRLCDAWNACAIKQDDWIVQQKDMQVALDHARESRKSLDDALANNDQRARRQALSVAYAVVPPEQRTQLCLTFSVDVEVPNDPSQVPAKPCDKDTKNTYTRAAARPMQAGEAIPSGSRVSFRVNASRDAYVYLYQRKADGTIEVIFPSKGIPMPNPIKGGGPQRIPSNGTYCVDENGIGIETVYIAASLGEMQKLGSKLAGIESSSAPPAAAAPPPPASSSCHTRDLKLDADSDSPAPTACDLDRGVKTRDLKLDADDTPAGAAPSVGVCTEAADDQILQEFKFEHMTPDAYAKLKASGTTKSRGIVVED